MNEKEQDVLLKLRIKESTLKILGKKDLTEEQEKELGSLIERTTESLKKSILQTSDREELTEEEEKNIERKIKSLFDSSSQSAVEIKRVVEEASKSKDESVKLINRILYTRFSIGKKNDKGEITPPWVVKKIINNIDKYSFFNLQLYHLDQINKNLEELYQDSTKTLIPFSTMRLSAFVYLLGELQNSYSIAKYKEKKDQFHPET
jgi:hypothetical protein